MQRISYIADLERALLMDGYQNQYIFQFEQSFGIYCIYVAQVCDACMPIESL